MKPLDKDAPLKVAIIGTRGYPSYYGGFETAVRKLAPFLSDHQWQVTVFGRPKTTFQLDPNRDRRVDSIITSGFNWKSLGTLTYGFTAARHARKQLKPDVVIVMNVANGFWLKRFKAKNIPTIVNVDGLEWERAKWGKVAKSVFRKGAKLTAKYATELVFDSNEIKKYWEHNFKRTGTFIPYGGDEQPHKLRPVNGTTIAKYVLFVARFVPENSTREFFEAVPSISKVAPVVIVGTSGHGSSFDVQAQTLAENFQNVSFLGQINDDETLHSLWQNCGVYFHGHTVGGTNPSLVQAMALGAPIVARRSVYNAEVLEPHSPFVEGDSKQIASTVLKVYRDEVLRKKLSEKNLHRARNHYTWEKVNESYLSIINELTINSRIKNFQ